MVNRNSTPNCFIWEAALATSAAPTFFKRIHIGKPKVGYLDAGLGYNNPVQQVFDEARSIFDHKRKVACILSLGTGEVDTQAYAKPGILERRLPIKLIKVLQRIATNSGTAAETFARRFEYTPGVYFRFNVPRVVGNLPMEEWRPLPTIAALTSTYMRETWVSKEIDRVVDVLVNPMGKGVVLGTAGMQA